MGWLLPKSLNGFLLLGLGFLAGPLLLAILHAAVQMRRLSDTSQQLVVDSVQSTRLTQDMYAQIALLERAARLYQVLGEPTVRASFREHDSRLAAIVGTLRQRLRAVDAPIGWHNWPMWSGAMALSTSLGFAVLFAPAGLGVREGILLGILTQAGVDAHAAVAATVLSRFVSFISDVLVAAAAYPTLRSRMISPAPSDRR